MRRSENCSCHISPPCSSCTAPRNYCDTCEWDEEDEEIPAPAPYTGKPWKPEEPRPLDPTKVDWRYVPHTNFTMIKEGVYPVHMTAAEVEKEVRGTFGGRFTRFDGGKFKYIAYTD